MVEVHAEGAGIRVEVPAEHALERREGRLVIAASADAGIDDEVVRSLRDAGRT